MPDDKEYLETTSSADKEDKEKKDTYEKIKNEWYIFKRFRNIK